MGSNTDTHTHTHTHTHPNYSESKTFKNRYRKTSTKLILYIPSIVIMNLFSKAGSLDWKMFRGEQTLYPLERFVNPTPQCSLASVMLV